MYVSNKRISLTCKIVAICVCLWGQLLASGLLAGTFNGKKYFYYTQQSNVLCLLYFTLAAVFCASSIKKSGPIYPATFAPRFKGAVMLAITVTMLIYWTLLHSPGNPSINMAESVTTHLLVPVLMIFDWLLFDRKGVYKKTDSLLWLCIPLIYWLFAILVAQTGITFTQGSRYPYFFIDSDRLGWGNVFLYVVALVAIFLVVGYLIFLTDRLMGRKTAKEK